MASVLDVAAFRPWDYGCDQAGTALPAPAWWPQVVKGHCPICNREHWKPRTVELGGQLVCTHSEAWRHACEVRWALRLPDKARKPRITKLDYLNGVEQQRGSEARFKLREDMLKEYLSGKTENTTQAVGHVNQRVTRKK